MGDAPGPPATRGVVDLQSNRARRDSPPAASIEAGLMTKPRIVLYNPRAVVYTMPLSLIALASARDRKQVGVRGWSPLVRDLDLRRGHRLAQVCQ